MNDIRTLQRDARSREIGEALQRTVAADPELAVSIVGIGVDALSNTLIHSPDQLPGYGPWVELLNAIYGYIMSGARSPRLDDLLAGSLSFRPADTPT